MITFMSYPEYTFPDPLPQTHKKGRQPFADFGSILNINIDQNNKLYTGRETLNETLCLAQPCVPILSEFEIDNKKESVFKELQDDIEFSQKFFRRDIKQPNWYTSKEFFEKQKIISGSKRPEEKNVIDYLEELSIKINSKLKQCPSPLIEQNQPFKVKYVAQVPSLLQDMSKLAEKRINQTLKPVSLLFSGGLIKSITTDNDKTYFLAPSNPSMLSLYEICLTDKMTTVKSPISVPYVNLKSSDDDFICQVDVQQVYEKNYVSYRSKKKIGLIAFDKSLSFEDKMQIDLNNSKHISISPVIPDELLIINSLGEIQMRKSSIIDLCISSKNYNRCEFSSHPRLIHASNFEESSLLDVRCKPYSVLELLSVPNQYVYHAEKIFSSRVHPVHKFYHYISTDFNFFIIDERFTKHPVFNWAHQLINPPSYIDFCSSLSADCNDLLFLSSQIPAETHTFMMSLCTNSPPQLFDLPIRLSTPEDISTTLSSELGDKYKQVKDRLCSALLGTCSVKHFRENNSLTTFQINTSGDIFSQILTFEKRSVNEKLKLFNNFPQYSLKNKELTQNWCDNLVKQLPKPVEIVDFYSDPLEIFADYKSSLKPSHPSCNFCSKLVVNSTATQILPLQSTILASAESVENDPDSHSEILVNKCENDVYSNNICGNCELPPGFSQNFLFTPKLPDTENSPLIDSENRDESERQIDDLTQINEKIITALWHDEKITDLIKERNSVFENNLKEKEAKDKNERLEQAKKRWDCFYQMSSPDEDASINDSLTHNNSGKSPSQSADSPSHHGPSANESSLSIPATQSTPTTIGELHKSTKNPLTPLKNSEWDDLTDCSLFDGDQSQHQYYTLTNTPHSLSPISFNKLQQTPDTGASPANTNNKQYPLKQFSSPNLFGSLTSLTSIGKQTDLISPNRVCDTAFNGHDRGSHLVNSIGFLATPSRHDIIKSKNIHEHSQDSDFQIHRKFGLQNRKKVESDIPKKKIKRFSIGF